MYAILNWLYAWLDHPRKVCGGLCHCAKFGCNQCSRFDHMQVLILCALGFIMHIHALLSVAWGQNGINRNFLQFYSSMNASKCQISWRSVKLLLIYQYNGCRSSYDYVTRLYYTRVYYTARLFTQKTGHDR